MAFTSDKAKIWLVNLRGWEPCRAIISYPCICNFLLDSLLPCPVPLIAKSILVHIPPRHSCFCQSKLSNPSATFNMSSPPLLIFTSHTRRIGVTRTPPPIAMTTAKICRSPPLILQLLSGLASQIGTPLHKGVRRPLLILA